ncbi:amino-acid N-acetyltransferase [Hahella sp. CCB-MM4]|uniref:amino-acid N-acetyltransferase n=1 Tax=Hahella sp. (strain CCB-MM4) TaxID=1926491 RepID=UPI001FEF1B41|nr:amino-acid N-acetyltransferase [Hahella sp. CCB-MM4]
MNDGNQTDPVTTMPRDPSQQVYWFRHSAPYIHAYRGRTVVILMPGEVLADKKRMSTIVQDIALLSSLGLKLVVAYGARPQIDERLNQCGLPVKLHHGLRITGTEELSCVTEVVGRLRSELEARLSMGLASSPMHGAALQVSSGNFVVARPVGVVDGLDMCHTGLVRKVHAESIHKHLSMGHIVLLPTVGYSPTGEIFNLSCEDVASSAAVALKADKLILLGQEQGVFNPDGQLLREISLAQALQQLEFIDKGSEQRRRLFSVCRAVQNGVSRAHLVSYHQDGALLHELFTRDGVGTLVTDESYDEIRPATIDDVGGILALIRPLEEQGVLVRRSRELLEREIGNFIVDDRDGAIIACAALYIFPEENCAELACVAVRPSYARQGRGDKLLAGAEKRARDAGMKELFVLTTQTSHWFIERGFKPATVGQLPVAKQNMYNLQRNSKVFIKSL